MSGSQSDAEGWEGDLEPSGRRRRPKTSRSCRAGLIFPVGRIDRFLRRGDYAVRIGAGASVYLAAVLQYLTYDVMDIAGNIAARTHRRRISPGHVQQALSGDTELQVVFGGAGLTPEKASPANQPTASTQKRKKPGKSVGAQKAVAT